MWCKGGSGSRLFITNLASQVDWWQLKEHCRTYNVTARLVDIVCDSKSGLRTGEALVDLDDSAFDRIQEAGRRLTGTILFGRPLFACPDPRGLSKPAWQGRDFDSGDQQQAGTSWHSRFGERDPSGDRPADGGKLPYRRRQRQLLSRSRSRNASGSAPAAAPRVVPPPLHLLKKALPLPQPDPADQALRRLFVEGLSSTVTLQALKRHVADQNFEVVYVDIVRSEEASFGIIEFKTRLHALEACMMLSGSMIDKDDAQPIWLRQDRSEFDEIKAAGLRNSNKASHECSEAMEDKRRAFVPPPPPPAGWAAAGDEDEPNVKP